jgi:hypothetical protein
MASGTIPIDSAWAQEAIRRNREGQDAANIAVAVGKNAATVRKVLRAAREQGVLPRDPIADSNRGISANGNGDGARGRRGVPAEPPRWMAGVMAGEQIPGQTTVDDHLRDEPDEDGREMDAGDDEAVFVEEIRVDGTAQLGLFNAGGKSPESASLRLSGGRILLVDGQAFRKGETIRFSGTAVVREVAQRDKPDGKTGIVVSAEQKHVAQITDLRVE